MFFFDITKPTAIVAHDAGAANHIFSWYQDVKKLPISLSLSGPAKRIWECGGAPIQYCSIEDALSGVDFLISGTSYQSFSEHNARTMAKDRGIYNIAVIDHWVNYLNRFKRCNRLLLPDEIWVTDALAKKISEENFPNIPVFVQKNLYLERLTKRISSLESAENCQEHKVLYVLEPIRGEWANGHILGEFQALEYFISNFQRLNINANCEIILRPHPSDPPGKYEYFVKRHSNMNITVNSDCSLEQAIAFSNIVVGCETYAMIVAAAAQKKVISSLPPHAPRCRLPIEGLVHLCDLS